MARKLDGNGRLDRLDEAMAALVQAQAIDGPKSHRLTAGDCCKTRPLRKSTSKS